MKGELRQKFALRSKEARNATTIYLIVSFMGRQWKISTALKVIPTQFQNGRCTISKHYSNEDNKRNLEINSKLNEIELGIYNYYLYICNEDNVKIAIDKLNNYLIENVDRLNSETKKMKKKQIIRTASALLSQAFIIMYNQEGVKQSTRDTNYSMLKNVINLIEKGNIVENNTRSINQSFINNIKRELEKNLGVSRLNNTMQLICRLINDILCIEDRFLEYNIQKVNYKSVKEDRKQDDKKARALTIEEQNKIRNVELDSTKEYYRNIFLLQIEIGQRIGDLDHVITNIDLNNEWWSYIPTKENRKHIKAYININNNVRYLISKIRSNYRKIDRKCYGKVIKEVCKECGFTENYEYFDSKNNKIIRPLFECISSHWARHTFITNKVNEGWNKEQIIKCSGHADIEMINKVYAHRTEETDIELLNKQITELKRNSKIISICNNDDKCKTNNTNDNEINEYKKVLSMMNIDSREWIELDNIDELSRIVHLHEQELNVRFGIDYKAIKEIFNSNGSIKDKSKMLEEILNNIG